MSNSPRDPIIRTVPQPADMNGNGDIFGGWVLSQMDIAGGTLAALALMRFMDRWVDESCRGYAMAAGVP